MFVVGAGDACAHVMLDSAQPGAGALLETPPAAIVLHFDGVLDTTSCRIRVEDALGKPVVTGPIHSDGQRGSSLRLKLPVLAPGRYHVHWLAVARDGHRTSGDYVFTIK